MKNIEHHVEAASGTRGPWLVLIMLALIIGLVAMVLILHPRGVRAQGGGSPADPAAQRVQPSSK